MPCPGARSQEPELRYAVERQARALQKRIETLEGKLLAMGADENREWAWEEVARLRAKLKGRQETQAEMLGRLYKVACLDRDHAQRLWREHARVSGERLLRIEELEDESKEVKR